MASVAFLHNVPRATLLLVTATDSAPPRTVRAGIYCRISQDRAGEALGVARQSDECRAICERSDWTIADVYVDNDLSAYSGKPRPEYERLMRDVAGGLLDVIVAWHPDRLHRSPAELEAFIKAIELNGVDVRTVVTGEIDLATPSGRMHARMLGTIARYESEHKSERLRSKHLELARNGKVSGGGRRPFGFTQDRRSVVDAEAVLIREAADRVLSGDSLYAIKQDWTERGVPTVTGAEWSTTAIKAFLTSARIAGLRSHQGKVVSEAEWPAVLDRTTWRRVCAVLEDQTRRPRRNAARTYLLTGMLRCASCGHRMVGAPRGVKRGAGRRGQYFVEHGTTQRAYGCVKANGGCGSVYILAEPVERFVVDMIHHRLSGSGLTQARSDLAERDAGHDRLVAVIAEAEQAITDLGAEWARKEISRQALLAAQQVHERTIAEARQKMAATARTAALDDVDDLAGEWASLPLDRQRSIIETLVSAIDVAPASGARNRFDLNRLTPRWLV